MDEQYNHRLTREQKVGFTLLLLFGVMTISLGFLQMRNTLYKPYLDKNMANADADIQNIFDNEDVRLQALDTDQDGLNNYDEIYFYGTSAYLPDTDSDGIKDKTEIDSGTDPLCPKDEQCINESGAEMTSTSTQLLGGVIGEDPGDAPPVMSGGQPAVGDITQLEDLLNDPDQVRSLLANTGQFTPDQLTNISDEQLITLVQELIDEQFGSQTQAEAPQAETP